MKILHVLARGYLEHAQALNMTTAWAKVLISLAQLVSNVQLQEPISVCGQGVGSLAWKACIRCYPDRSVAMPTRSEDRADLWVGYPSPTGGF